MYWNTFGRSGLSIFDLDVSLGRAKGIGIIVLSSPGTEGTLYFYSHLPFPIPVPVA